MMWNRLGPALRRARASKPRSGCAARSPLIPTAAALLLAAPIVAMGLGRAAAQAPAEEQALPPAATLVPEPSGAAEVDGAPDGAGVADALERTGAAQTRPLRPLRVGVAGSPPFNFVDATGTPTGPSLEIWDAIATHNRWVYEVQVMPSASAAVDGVADGNLDVAIGPISITAERAARVAFTQPYWQADLAILSTASGGGSILNPEMLGRLGKACAVLLLMLLSVGSLIYWAERRAQSIQTLGDAVWFALVTMTTVGYGDRVPVTRVGRLLTSLWMLFAMVFGASLTAQIATALTLAELDSGAINSANDLRGHRVASKAGSTALSFITAHGGRAVAAPSLEEAVALLLRGDVEAVVFDRPALQYQESQHPDAELVIGEAGYDAQGYGFAFDPDAGLRRLADVALLELREDGQLEEIGNAWIQGTRTPAPAP